MILCSCKLLLSFRRELSLRSYYRGSEDTRRHFSKKMRHKILMLLNIFRRIWIISEEVSFDLVTTEYKTKSGEKKDNYELQGKQQDVRGKKGNQLITT